MNVAARLCEYCKTINQRLVVSGGALRLMTIPADVEVGKGDSIPVRGRREPVEANVVRQRGPAGEVGRPRVAGASIVRASEPMPAGSRQTAWIMSLKATPEMH